MSSIRIRVFLTKMQPLTDYWLAFREDYEGVRRHMAFDITRLQLVEQLPNVGTVVVSGLTQGALINSSGLPPVLAANLGNWFGPHKIVNFVAMVTSNSLKKAWVDGSWKPLALIQNTFYGLIYIRRNPLKATYPT